MLRHLSLIVALCVSLSLPVVAAAQWQIQQRWKIGGDGGWDYLSVEPGSVRLFISRGNRVDVIDTSVGRIVGTVPNTLGVHGIAFAKALNRGYTSNGRANSVSAFALDTLALIQEAKIPARNPDAILFEPNGKHVFTFNGSSKDVTVLDAETMTVLTTFAAPGKPEFAAEDEDAGTVFANIESNPGQMLVIDAKTLQVKAVWPLPGCDSPTGLAIDAKRHRLFSVCDNKIMTITDSLSGKQIARAPIGEHADAAVYDARRHLVFSSNGDGTLTVISQKSADNYAPSAPVVTQLGARTMALDPTTGKVYLVTADFALPEDHAQPATRPLPIPGSFVVLQAGAS